MKCCKRCEKLQPLAEFYRGPRYRDRYQPWCKSCYREVRAVRYQSNRAKTLEQNRQWAKRNVKRRRKIDVAKQHRRRALKRGAKGVSTPEQIDARRIMFGGRCWMCGDPAEGMDHVIPLARGGTNWPANLRPACHSCNASKRDSWEGVMQLCQLTTTKRDI